MDSRKTINNMDFSYFKVVLGSQNLTLLLVIPYTCLLELGSGYKVDG